ncbi:MAG: discoidin domain-containing protein [Alloprevotella sp.]
MLKAYNEENSDFFTNNIWAQTQMFYKLWLYYHLAGHNNKFYPRLFEMLRRDPISRTYNQLDVQTEENGTVVTGKTPLLHFYKKCCLAAGEDLTEFFRAYGFFTPMDKRYVGDYSSSEYTQTQAQINATIAEVKALGYPENHTVLFINDCTTGATFYQHDGVTQRAWWDNNTYSDLGAYTDYNGTTSNDEVTGTYELTAANGTATMSGATGGAGFLIYDENGNLLSFSSDYSFPLSDAALLAIANGTATVQVLNAEGNATPVVYDGGSAAISLLSGLLDDVKIVVDAVDNGGDSGTDYTKVGFYKQPEVATLITLYNQAKALYDDNAQSGYVSAYSALKAEYDAVMANEFARVALLPGSTCVLVNKSVPTRYLNETESNTVTTTNVSSGVVVADVPEAGQWVVEASTTTAGAYNFKNVSTGNYWQALSQSVQLQTGETAKDYTFIDNNNGSWSIKYSENKQLIHKEGGNTIVGWGDTSNQNSHWYITMVSKDESVEVTANLQTLVAQTTALINKMANVSGKGAQDMSTFRITSNATEQGHGTELMVDGDKSTFFHTVWSGTAVNENHYFQIDCGEGLSLGDFVLSYTTRPTGTGGNDAPTNIIITGSNTTDVDGNVTGWEDITTLSEGLPTGKAASYTSGTIGSSLSPYRYLRFTVTTASGGTFGGYYYFGIAELGISRPEAQVNSIVAKYAAAALGANQLTNDKLITADGVLYNSKQLLASGTATASDLTTQYETLKAQYDILLATYNAAENADLDVAKAALQTVISNTQTLLDECGAVDIVKAEVPLQTSDVYCNAPYTAQNNGDYTVQGDDGYHLLDGNKTTFLHTDYSGSNSADGLDHYVRINTGAAGVDVFRILYTTRNSGDGQPTSIVIEGSNEEAGTYTELATLTKDDETNPLPITNGTDYVSDYFGALGTTYQYIRLRVTGNKLNQQKGGHYWFCLAELSIERKPSTTINNNNVGAVMDDDILTTYNAIEAAQTAYDLATTVAQLNAAQADLQAQYDVLNAAKTTVLGRDDLKAAIDDATTLKNSCYETDAQGNNVVKADYLSNPNFSLEDLQALESAITTATTVYRTVAATDEEVTAQETALAAAMAQLNRSFDYMALPITLTTNETAPVKYVMYVNRGDNILSQYRGTVWPNGNAEANNYKIHLAPNGVDHGNPYQAFYFTRGTSGTQLLLKAAADGRTFAVETGNLVTNGYNKVASYDMATTSATFAAQEWVMVANESNSGWFNIKAVPADAENTNIYYFSNWGGVNGNQNYGFYGDVNDSGNLFRFEAWQEADKSALEAAIASLNSAYDSCYDIDGDNRTLKAAYDNVNFDATVLDGVATLVNEAQTVLADADQYQLAAEAKAAELNAKIADIQAQQNLATLPVTLTTDTNDPVLYTIHFERNTTPYYLQYRGDESHGDYRNEYDYNKLKYNATLEGGNIYQAFYFTRGTEGARLYMNAAADGKVFSVITGDLGAGAGKVKAFAADEATQTFAARQWTITANAANDGWFNIAPAPNATTPVYLHNWNGITENPANIGFDTAADNAGSLFQFAPYQPLDKTDLNAALATLKTAYADCFSDAEGTTIKSDYDGSLNLTAANLAEVKAVIDAAQAVSDDTSVFQSAVDEQTALVQAQQIVLQNLVAYAALPVKLTTDPAAPHYYRIYVNRDGRPLWQARTTDDSNGGTKVQLTTSYDLGVDRQAWYFTAASEGPKVYIVNKNTPDRVLACTTGDFAVGAGKLQGLAVDAGNVGANEWTITNEASTSGWYNITTVKTTTAQDGSTTNTTFYISNHGGAGNNMGFYNNATDPGSNFQFEEIDPTRSAAYNQLYNYFHDETRMAIDMTAEPPAFPSEWISDTAIGYYSESLASDYTDAYVSAYYFLEYGGEDSYLTTAYRALVAANEALVGNEIDFNAYYVLRSANSGYSSGALAYAKPEDNKAYWHAAKPEVSTLYTVSLDNGTRDNGTAAYWKTWTSTESPAVTFVSNANNIATASDNTLLLYSGGTNSATYTLNAPSGYVIDTYAFSFANKDHSTALTLTIGDDSWTTTSATQTHTVDGCGQPAVVMTLAGDNGNAVQLSGFTVTLRPECYESESVNIWQFEQGENGEVYLKNLHTGTYMTNTGSSYRARQLSTSPQPVTFSALGDSQLNIKVNGSQLHAQADLNCVVIWNGGKNSASAWYIEPVANPGDIRQTVTISAYRYAGFYAAWPVALPEGLQAWYIPESTLSVETYGEGNAALKEITGTVPAHTGVLLYGEPGRYALYYSEAAGAAPDDNMLLGSPYLRYIQGETGTNYYLFGVKNGNVGLYQAWLEYTADGSQTITDDSGEESTEVSTDDTDLGGYFRVGAGKVYMPYSPAEDNPVEAFLFSFLPTTDIEAPVPAAAGQDTIYDLSGRRLERITTTGIYIVNGQKRMVRVR